MIAEQLAEQLARYAEANPDVFEGVVLATTADQLGGVERLMVTIRPAAGPIEPHPVGTRPCPECVTGKHANCNGLTWETVVEDYTRCPCEARGHR